MVANLHVWANRAVSMGTPKVDTNQQTMEPPGTPSLPTIQVLEHVFVAIFSIELLLRARAMGKGLLKSGWG